jgi:excisionase family DNA binding protein
VTSLNIHFELPGDTILLSRQDLKATLKELISEIQLENSADAVLNIKETAKLLKVSVPTVRKLISNGDIPYFQRGQLIRVLHSDVLEWIKYNSK